MASRATWSIKNPYIMLRISEVMPKIVPFTVKKLTENWLIENCGKYETEYGG